MAELKLVKNINSIIRRAYDNDGIVVLAQRDIQTLEDAADVIPILVEKIKKYENKEEE